MADELPNAVELMRDSTFRDWIIAAIGYTARQVIQESPSTPQYDARRRLAEPAVLDPAVFADRFVNVIATDPAVAAKGTTVQLVGQALVLQKVSDLWTPLATLIYPDPPA